MLLPSRKKKKKKRLSLHPFARRSSTELRVSTFCSGSQWTRILHAPLVLCLSPRSSIVWTWACKQYRRKISSAIAFLFLSSVFFSPFIHFYLFICHPLKYWGFLFSHSIWFPLLIPFVLTLLLFVWWGWPDSRFLLLRPLGNGEVWNSTVVFQQFFHIYAGHFPRACFLLLYLIKLRQLPLIPMGVTWCHVGFSIAWNHTSPWWVSENRLALVYVGGWCCQKCHWGVTASADPIWALLGVWTSGSKRPYINNFPSSSW